MPSFCFSLLNSRWYNYLYHLIPTASTLQPTSALSTHFFFLPSCLELTLRDPLIPPAQKAPPLDLVLQTTPGKGASISYISLIITILFYNVTIYKP